MKTYLQIALLALLLPACSTTNTPTQSSLAPSSPHPPLSTFSIIAYDPQTKELGIAVQSKFIAVGAVVPWAKADIGAVATQSWANTTFGPNALKLLARGKSPKETLQTLLKADPGRDFRQLAIIDAKGNPVTFTGKRCQPWAGGITGKNFAAQGNILAGPQVVKQMAETFQNTQGELAHRLIQALAAAQKAGGDKRGKQSAALLIVRKKAGYSRFNDRYRDLRVDDHSNPIQELNRIYLLHKKIFPPPKTKPKSP